MPIDVSTSDVGLTIATNPNISPSLIAPRPAPPEVLRSATGATGGFLSRQHILEATEAVFSAAGYDGTTIRAIAGKLGCAVGSIYRYFDDKATLLLACSSRVIEPVVNQFEYGVSIGDSIRLYVRQARAHAEMYSLLIWLGARAPAPGTGVASVIENVIAGWSKLGADGRAIWATVHGMLVLGAGEEQIVTAATPGHVIKARPMPRPMPHAIVLEPVVEVAASPVASAGAEPEDVTLL